MIEKLTRSPHGPIGSWSRGIVNSIPIAVMLLLGLMQRRASRKDEAAGVA